MVERQVISRIFNSLHRLEGPLWEGCRESKRGSMDTYPESYITKYTSIRRKHDQRFWGLRGRWGCLGSSSSSLLSLQVLEGP